MRNCTREEFLDIIVNFDIDPRQSLNIKDAEYSRKIKKIFGGLKPKAIRVQNWLLYEFGFRRCSYIKNILPLNAFTKDSSQYGGYSYVSKEYDKLKSQIRYKNNPESFYIANLKRKHSIKNRIPHWFTSEDELKIQALYKEAKELEYKTGISYELDHIIPLQGKYVSGLHHPSNLRLIPVSDNLLKIIITNLKNIGDE